MTKEERATYETQNGYISFGRYCDELYNKIDFDKFKSQEEIFSFVYENKDYLKLTDEAMANTHWM
jgi:CRISPR/Cas system CMR-associated protein Cmr3 (group 5 of RAMP superfamily)